MRKFVNKIFGQTAKEPQSQLCQHHSQKMFKNVLANEHCHTCGIDICYMCGNQHQESHCNVSWGKPKQFENRNQKLFLYNHGFMAKLLYKELKCECGSPINHKDPKSGICVACGTAHCSSECHHKYAEQTQNCNFHENFTYQLNSNRVSLRSILLTNITYLYENQMSMGTPVCKTSNSMVKGYLGDHPSFIYLQRGFRQFGQPSVIFSIRIKHQKKWRSLKKQILISS